MSDPIAIALAAIRAQELADMLASLSPEQLGQLQFIVGQVNDPQGLRVFQIPKSGVMDTYQFPYFMSLYFEQQGITMFYLFDMREPDFIVLSFL
jgi:hypothetical protein